MVDDVAGVDQMAVDLAGHGGLGKARADRLGDVHDGDGFVELAAAAVWERDVDHGTRGVRVWERDQTVDFCGARMQERRKPRCFTCAPSRLPPLLRGIRNSSGQQKRRPAGRSEEHTSELQSLMRISYAVFCLNKK